MQMQTQRAFRETQEQIAKMARVIDELREQVGKGRKERD
jgi:two-component sensor histidine kinase